MDYQRHYEDEFRRYTRVLRSSTVIVALKITVEIQKTFSFIHKIPHYFLRPVRPIGTGPMQNMRRPWHSMRHNRHLLVVSCTGFISPGVEIELIQQLGLSSRIARTSIGFMGCHGALNGLKMAHDICQAHPRSRVLMVCVELCTLHFQIEDSIESVVTNALFSDGAAAVILSADPPLIDGKSVGKSVRKSLFYRRGESLILPDSQELMNWTIGDTGFLMGLSPQVPDRIGAGIFGYVQEILGEQGLSQSQMDFWAIHPGGIEIVRQVQSALNLPVSKLQESYDVLRDYGNMSSPTILFILKRILDRVRQEDLEQPRSAASQLGSAMAFGPGLTIEFALFQIL
jgi:alpha-pyrone synthase